MFKKAFQLSVGEILFDRVGNSGKVIGVISRITHGKELVYVEFATHLVNNDAKPKSIKRLNLVKYYPKNGELQ